MIFDNVDLEQLRKVHSKSQEDVAKYLGVSIASYRNKEQGTNGIWLKESYLLTKLYGCKFEDVYKAMLLTQKKKNKSKKRK